MFRLETTGVCSIKIEEWGEGMEGGMKTVSMLCGRKRRGKETVIIMCLLLIIMNGCGRQRVEDAPADGGREKIVLWSYYETEAQHDALDELVQSFNLEQDRYEASWEYVPMTDFTKKLTMAYTEQALPDLALIDNPDMPVCIKMGMFEDITEFLEELQVKEEYYPDLLQTVTADGRMYGIPAVCNNVALIYNRKYLKEAGIEPPRNREELRDAAKKLTTEGRDGFLMCGIDGQQGAFQILPWILSTGEPADRLGGEGTEEALAFLYGLMEDGCMTHNCINLSQTDVARVFLNGEAAMMENGPWIFPMLEAAGMDYGVSPLPTGETGTVIAGGENFGILKGKNREGAELFLEYYNEDAVMRKFCEKTCSLPAKTGVRMRDQSKMQVIEEQMKGAVVRSRIPSWNRMSEELTEVFYRMTVGEISPEQAAASLRTEGNNGPENSPPTLND